MLEKSRTAKYFLLILWYYVQEVPAEIQKDAITFEAVSPDIFEILLSKLHNLEH